jgi:16S rRNA (guanine966-N2)-methyltransferase
VRVISGSARGRPLRSVESRAVRPTTDMVKGAIFSMLEAEAFKRGLAEPGYSGSAEGEEEIGGFPWNRVLDLYAGSGALGIECLSRGARTVEFVESDARAREVIRDNLTRTGLAGRAQVHGLKAESAVSTLPGPYDLILLDPPYSDASSSSVFQQLCASDLVTASTFIVLEHPRDREVPPACGQLRLLKTRFHGRTGISMYAARPQGSEQ